MQETLSHTLRTARVQKGLSLRKLSALSGVSVGAIQTAENGTRQPFDYILGRLAPALDLDLDHLLAMSKAEADAEAVAQ